MDIRRVENHFQLISRIYPENSNRKNYFLAACKSLDNYVILDVADNDRIYGGIIGMDNSRLDYFLKHFKIFRMHAVLHDAAGYMREVHNTGPGYCYALENFPINSCVLGHISGLMFCMWQKLFNSLYKQFDC